MLPGPDEQVRTPHFSLQPAQTPKCAHLPVSVIAAPFETGTPATCAGRKNVYISPQGPRSSPESQAPGHFGRVMIKTLSIEIQEPIYSECTSKSLPCLISGLGFYRKWLSSKNLRDSQCLKEAKPQKRLYSLTKAWQLYIPNIFLYPATNCFNIVNACNIFFALPLRRFLPSTMRRW